MFFFGSCSEKFFRSLRSRPPFGGLGLRPSGSRRRGGIKYCSASRARLEIIFRRSPKKSFALHGRSKSEISTGFFLTARRRELSPSAAGQAPEPQAQLGEVDLKVDRTLAFQVTIAIVSSTACPHIIPLMIQIS